MLGATEGLAHLGSRLVVGTRPRDSCPSARAHLLPGAGLPCPELDVAGDQLIPTCADTNSHQWEEEDKRQSERSLPTPSAHLEWVLVPSCHPWIPGTSQQQQEAEASLGDWQPENKR